MLGQLPSAPRVGYANIRRHDDVRGSPFGGRPGLLNICWRLRPEKISPIPAMLFCAGEVVSAGEPIFGLLQNFYAHISVLLNRLICE